LNDALYFRLYALLALLTAFLVVPTNDLAPARAAGLQARLARARAIGEGTPFSINA